MRTSQPGPPGGVNAAQYVVRNCRGGAAVIGLTGQHAAVDENLTCRDSVRRSAGSSGEAQALEKSETYPVMGRLLNGDYSGHLVPSNAHIPEADVCSPATSTTKPGSSTRKRSES